MCFLPHKLFEARGILGEVEARGYFNNLKLVGF